MSNFIFASQDDAIRYAIRKIYHDVLHREIESPATQNSWVDQWHQNGGDVVLAGIMDSPEGHQAIAAERRLLGI